MDIRHLIRSEVALLAPFDDRERLDQADVLNWIDSGAELFRLERPATPPKHLLSYSLIFSGEHLLLVDHINAELWLPTGGHVEEGEHPRMTSLREAREEVGLDVQAEIAAPQFLTVATTVGKTSGHTDVTLWYVLAADRSQPLQFDHSEFHDARWFHKTEIPWHRTDSNLRRFLNKFSPSWLQQSHSPSSEILRTV